MSATPGAGSAQPNSAALPPTPVARVSRATPVAANKLVAPTLPTEPAAPALAAPKRRRLWQLPAQAFDLLLALGLAPDMLRQDAQRALGRMHRRPCQLLGADADVLYSLVHDMGTRNPLSEALHKRLDQRHHLAVARMAMLRDMPAVQAAWQQALVDNTVPAALWALLTHPLGATLETAALFEARAWVFAHSRRSLAQQHSQVQAQERALEAQQLAGQLQARLLLQQQQAQAAAVAAQHTITRLRGELARLRQQTQAQTQAQTHAQTKAEAQPPAQPAPLAKPPNTEMTTAISRIHPHSSAQAAQPRLPPAAGPRPPTPGAEPTRQPQPQPQPVTVHGRRVLCVGGIQHAVARYRGRIEKLGGQFEHHDGGLEDSVQALDGRLSRADLVICQAACINHEAYHRIKRHCERTGTPCVYLDRPSLSRLDRALAQPLPAIAQRHTTATA